ncbi:MAG: hypothetical protein IKE94_09910 [Aeriscardovia sp.]|nr:hypothetical protein [Aeriscardovia sp.]
MMMTREEVKTMVESIGLPFAYYEFPDGTQKEPPFVVWLFGSDNDVIADDTNYCSKEVLAIELYTSIRDFEQEQAVEAVLTANGFVYSKEHNFIESERIWQIAYESEVIINEQG